ncbi:MAG: 2-C-methyl-D-erythritol 4-phosphate cytidylyltransferase [Ilumatobacter sp.]
MVRAELEGGRPKRSGSNLGDAPDGESKVWTIVVAGGSGQRFGRPKQFEPLDARRVIDVSREVAEACSDGVVVVVPEVDADRERAVSGGATRSESVRAGLAAVPPEAEVIVVHDAARPLASVSLYDSVVSAVARGAAAAIPGVPVTDTIKVIERSDPRDGPRPEVSGEILGLVSATPERSSLVAVQTPQAFRADVLRAAHASGGDATDDARLVEALGHSVVVVAGEVSNRKITEPDDLEWARAHLAAERAS